MLRGLFIVGITGGTGAGKTSALMALEKLGALVLDCDKIYHELLRGSEEMKQELERRFEGVLKDGEIDRKKLGETVFANSRALLDLNEITHKYVTRETDRRIAEWGKSGGTLAAIDAIALIESGIAEKCDIVVGVTAPEETRISRISARDGITREAAQSRINAQKPDSFFRENCEYYLENVYNTPEEFEDFCKKYFDEIISKGSYKNAR